MPNPFEPSRRDSFVLEAIKRATVELGYAPTPKFIYEAADRRHPVAFASVAEVWDGLDDLERRGFIARIESPASQYRILNVLERLAHAAQ